MTMSMTTPPGDGFTIRTDEVLTIRAPPAPNWEWCFNGDWSAFCVHLHTKTPPNRFHRFMLRWVVGIHWRPIK